MEQIPSLPMREKESPENIYQFGSDYERIRIMNIIDGFAYGNFGCSNKCKTCFLDLKQRITSSVQKASEVKE